MDLKHQQPFPPPSKGSRYIVVLSDYLTRWVEAFPVPSVEATVMHVFWLMKLSLDMGHRVCCSLTEELTFYLKSLQKFVKYFKFKRSILLVITHRPMVLWKGLIPPCVSLCQCTFPKTRKIGSSSYCLFCLCIGLLF